MHILRLFHQHSLVTRSKMAAPGFQETLPAPLTTFTRITMVLAQIRHPRSEPTVLVATVISDLGCGVGYYPAK